GVVAAFTGGLFGGVLQSPVVLVVIGVLLAALALSMFGLYELQPPPWMLERVGGAGTTGAVGIFLSGLVVGVIAAPCIGPPVVALLALVGARGDPWFGFQSFFTLALGLGAPYLVLGTFSNLLQRLPRSGDWMVWVKKVFGVIMLSVGAFYILLALAPRLSFWVLPVALLAGGLYLGFLDRSAGIRPGFRWLKWAVGVLAVAGGIGVIATTPSQGVAFETFDERALAATLESGTPVMLDFTANWCVPCHELERFTFSDQRVKEATRAFRAFKVDLTHYDSPEAERWRRQYGITGVPTVVFLAPDGSEVRAARVEGVLPPEHFLERVRLAEAAGTQAGL
ncbi:MAG: thioredoxin family protein, partial [Candidatus Eisenbacteria bacterium]